MIIAIDGPAASGKSTVARAVAGRLGLHYLDTGAMYRSVALLALETGTPLDDEEALARLAEEASIRFEYAEGASIPTRVLLDGGDVTAQIRTPEVDAAVSAVARVPAVRERMVALQREMASSDLRGCVVEGRDIGTVVFPSAEVKVFLTASPEERARRRWAERDADGRAEVSEVQADMERRDRKDSTREASPLAKAGDAVAIDTTALTAEQVAERVMDLARERA